MIFMVTFSYVINEKIFGKMQSACFFFLRLEFSAIIGAQCKIENYRFAVFRFKNNKTQGNMYISFIYLLQ